MMLQSAQNTIWNFRKNIINVCLTQIIKFKDAGKAHNNVSNLHLFLIRETSILYILNQDLVCLIASFVAPINWAKYFEHEIHNLIYKDFTRAHNDPQLGQITYRNYFWESENINVDDSFCNYNLEMKFCIDNLVLINTDIQLSMLKSRRVGDFIVLLFNRLHCWEIRYCKFGSKLRVVYRVVNLKRESEVANV